MLTLNIISSVLCKRLLFNCALLIQVLTIFNVPKISYGKQTENQRPEMNWQHTYITNTGQQMKTNASYNLHWSSDQTTVTFNVTVETHGWVGLGFSKDGTMIGADIVIGWVSNGVAYLTDRSAEDNIQPQLDDQQDYTLIYGAETDRFTTLVFKRNRNTGDCNDMVLDDTSTIILLWAWSTTDPGESGPEYHGTNRGTVDKPLTDKSSAKQKVLEDKDEQFYDIRMKKARPERKARTIYWDTFVPLPKLKQKHHIIRCEPVIDPGHEGLVHHFVVHLCYGEMPKELVNFSDEFLSIPPDTAMCNSIFYVWTVGAVGYQLPEDVGVSIGEKGDPQYVRLNVHFDNPNLPDDFEDSSGFRIVYTQNLRQHDTVMMAVGCEFNSWLFIPPEEDEFIARGWCLKECTNKMFPKDGVTIVAVGAHIHKKGRAFKFSQFRNGVHLKTIYQEDSIMPERQHPVVLLKDRVKVLPGDDLLTECLYVTSDIQNVTYGGNGVENEMCMSLIYYYPKTDLSYCLSVPKPKPLLEDLGFEGVRNFPLKPHMAEMQMALNSLDWTDQTIRDKYYRLVNTSDVYFRCDEDPMASHFPQLEGSIPVLKDYPLDQHYRRKSSNQCGKP